MQCFLKYAFLVMFFCISFHCFAQKRIANTTLTLNPFSFVDTDAGFTPGVGFDFSKKFSFYSDIGILFSTPYASKQDQNLGNSLIGYKFKPTIRFFSNKKSIEEVSRGFFLDAEFLLKHAKYKRFNALDIFDNFGNRLYSYVGGYNIIKNVRGITIKVGYRAYLDENRKMGIDAYMGLGTKTRTFKTPDLPSGARISDVTFNDTGFYNSENGDSQILNVAFGIKFIYRLSKTIKTTK